MSEFFKSYPDVHMAPEETSTATVVASLHAGKFDAAFVRSPTAEFEGLSLEPIAEDDTLAVLPERHRLHQSPSIELASFAKEKILTPRALNSGLYDAIIAACQHAGFEPVLGRGAPSVIAVIAMVAAGYGVSIIPQSLSRLRLKGVIYLPIRGHRAAAPISLAHRRDERSPTVRNLVSIVRRSAAPLAQVKASG